MTIYSDKACPPEIRGRRFSLAGLEGTARKGIELYIESCGGIITEEVDENTDCLIYRPGYPGYGETTEKYRRASMFKTELITALQLELCTGKPLNFRRRAGFEKHELAEGYLRGECNFASEDMDEIRAYTRKNAEAFMNLAFKNDDAAMLERLLELSFNGEASYIDSLTARAADGGCTKLAAFLLNFKGAHFSADELLDMGDIELQKELGFMERSEDEWRQRFRFEKRADGICVLGSLMLSDTVEIPAFICGEPVCSVGGASVGHRTDIKRVILPPTVKRINNFAFNGCTGLTDVIISRGTEYIGRGAFQQCTALTALRLPEGMREIDATAFFGCEKLRELSVPESLEKIGNYAFFGCKNLLLRVKHGSCAEKYAKENNINFEII